jgi:8-oxo-dGTP pyrophosphatase MutT (NUDIX family)
MSEAIPGVEFEPPPVRVRDAAVVVLVRGDGPDLEVFWVRRGERLAFSGGFYAFPGGSVDRADREAAVSGCPTADAPLLACAIRETFEEAGVLLVPEARDWPAERLSALRAELLAGAPFAALLAREGVRLDARGLLPAGRWVTPEISPIRFDARFYLARVPAGTPASVIPGELSDGAWIAPSAALAQWENGGALLHPPNRHALAVLAGFPSWETTTCRTGWSSSAACNCCRCAPPRFRPTATPTAGSWAPASWPSSTRALPGRRSRTGSTPTCAS